MLGDVVVNVVRTFQENIQHFAGQRPLQIELQLIEEGDGGRGL